jgi:hypothetical protein
MGTFNPGDLADFPLPFRLLQRLEDVGHGFSRSQPWLAAAEPVAAR